MLRHIIGSILFFMVVVFSTVCWAQVTTLSSAQPVSNLQGVKSTAKVTNAVVTPGVNQLTQFRWANHPDAVSGNTMMVLVFDVSGPVEVEGALTDTPTPQLTVNVKQSTPGKISRVISLDKQIANSVNIEALDGSNTKISVDLPFMIGDSDYKVYTLPASRPTGKNFRIVVEITRPTIPAKFTSGLKNKVIAIDPGHGGSDVGAIGGAQSEEKNVTLAVALKLKALLETAGAKVLMTRQVDRDVYAPNDSAVEELQARSNVANSHKADIFISIHANASASREVGGTTTYYYKKSRYDSLLAQSLQTSLLEADGLDDRGAMTADFYVLKKTVMPAALVETAFISNPNEEKLLNSPWFQAKMAQGLERGIDRFFTKVSKG